MSGSVFFASGRTAIYRNVGIFTTVIGFLVSCLLILPKFGLGLGSVGLSLKMVILQVFSANVLIYCICRDLEISFWANFGHQVIVLLLCSLCGLLSSTYLLHFTNNVFVSLSASAAIYFPLVFCAIWAFPGLIARSKHEMTANFQLVLKRFGFVHEQ